jgi:hypothetical protein
LLEKLWDDGEVSAPEQDSPGVRLRPRFGLVLTLLVAALAVAALATFIVVGDPLGMLLHGWGVVLTAFAVWLLFWAPAVTIGEHAVIVDNPLRRVTVPWAAIERIDTRWSLRLYTRAGSITAWSAPAPSRYAMARVSKAELKGLPESTYGPGDSVGLGDLPESESGLAAYYVRRRWEQLRDDDALTGSTLSTTQWQWVRIAALVALTAATIAGFFLP